jgi:hypothetical protein
VARVKASHTGQYLARALAAQRARRAARAAGREAERTTVGA